MLFGVLRWSHYTIVELSLETPQIILQISLAMSTHLIHLFFKSQPHMAPRADPPRATCLLILVLSYVLWTLDLHDQTHDFYLILLSSATVFHDKELFVWSHLGLNA